MTYLLDTNILLIYLRNNPLSVKIDKKFTPLSFPNKPVVSVVSLGEIQSIGLRNHWGEKRLGLLNRFIKKFLIADINVETVIQRYAEIDAYSQGKLAGKLLSGSARNMGKNDLWIAATASVLNATLLTLDHDFDHLADEYLNLAYVEFDKGK
jgi:predicted nucleic acid-binding protein